MRRAALLLAAALGGCTEDAAPPAACTEGCAAAALDAPILVLSSDLTQASALGLVNAQGCFDARETDLALGGDATLSQASGRSFVCGRDLGVVHEIDPVGLRILRTHAAAPAGEGIPPNPQDVGVDEDGRLWILRYNLSSVGLVEADGSWGGSVDLAALADADGVPEMAAVRIVGGVAYVSLQRLNGDFQVTGPGVMATIDVRSRVVGSFPLVGGNPFGRMVPVVDEPSGTIVTVVTPGDFDAIAASDGIERVDLAGGLSTQLISEVELGGSPIAAVVVGPNEGFAIVAEPVPGVHPTRVVAFDPAAGVVTRVLADSRAEAEGFYHADLAVSGGTLVVADRTPGGARLRLFDRQTLEEAMPICARDHPPFSLVPVGR
jgi:hypothetical protein